MSNNKMAAAGKQTSAYDAHVKQLIESDHTTQICDLRPSISETRRHSGLTVSKMSGNGKSKLGLRSPQGVSKQRRLLDVHAGALGLVWPLSWVKRVVGLQGSWDPWRLLAPSHTHSSI